MVWRQMCFYEKIAYDPTKQGYIIIRIQTKSIHKYYIYLNVADRTVLVMSSIKSICFV